MAEVAELLRDLVEEVRGLRADLSTRGQVLTSPRVAESSLSRADLALLPRLLPAIAGALGSEPFASRDLAADASPGLRSVLRDLREANRSALVPCRGVLD
jgi:hypothetical protein